MTLFLHNSIARAKQAFAPIESDHVRMYVCGPTVYDRAHLGNARSAVVFDALYRVLKHLYPRVTYVRNITDVDDKINAAAIAQGRAISTITEQTTQWYFDDMAALHVILPDHSPRATAFIPEMVTMIERLIERGHAYASHGHVLFRVGTFPNYGSLSGSTPDAILAGARVETAPYKGDPRDFVLWKPSEDTLPGWDSPWGRGRPGWHIECSAMSHALLGFPFDIHGGGHDLLFPHHENEVAQGACAHASHESHAHDVARFWVHNGFLTVDGEKMSKSRGNFICAHELVHHHPGEVIRLALLATHYRHALDWTAVSIKQAAQALDRFYTALQRTPNPAAPVRTDSAENPFFIKIRNALCDDINTPLALSILHEAAGVILRGDDGLHLAATALRAGGQLMGLLNHDPFAWFTTAQKRTQGDDDLNPSMIAAQILERQQARDNRDFARADAIRAALLDRGVVLEDSAGETRWKYLRDVPSSPKETL